MTAAALLRDTLVRLVEAHEEWDRDTLRPKVDRERARRVDEELEAALAGARDLLSRATA